MIIRRFVSLFATPLAKIIAFILLAGTSVLIALGMLLGNEAGQFVIRVRDDSTEKSIALTTDYEDPTTYNSTLHPEGMTGFGDYSAAYFIRLGYNDLDAITAETGIYHQNDNENNRSLYVYTFYIVNTTADGSNVGVDVSMTYSKVTNNVDKAIRVMTYARSSESSIPEIYMHSDDEDIDYVRDYDYVIEPQIFEEETNTGGTVFTKQHYTIGSTASQMQNRVNYMKYSVFFWLEGNDPECDERIFGGTIRFDLQVTVSM
jgi:hypothetical protein